MIVRTGDFADPKVLAVLREHLAGMQSNSPLGSVYALDVERLRSKSIAFYSVWNSTEDVVMAIGALKEIDPVTGEVKSMRTAQGHLRRGAAAFLLEFLINKALQRGYRRLCLETGSGPAFEPALALYRRYGFENCEPFGDYEASGFNQFLHLQV
ncbi:MAG: GNAT family N-acetyltransferase [Hyphomonadaceae bacterium]|jgi:putative acetyltransferase|nr:GNAT family N-acetyltransferase [Aquidulcibacter sp.]